MKTHPNGNIILDEGGRPYYAVPESKLFRVLMKYAEGKKIWEELFKAQ